MLVTNDLDNGTADIYDAALSSARIVTLEPGQSLKSLAARFKGTPLVIDFGGFVESRVLEAADMAHVTVVPLSYQSTADLMPAVKTVTAIQPHCARIVVLINNTAPEHVGAGGCSAPPPLSEGRCAGRQPLALHLQDGRRRADRVRNRRARVTGATPAPPHPATDRDALCLPRPALSD